MLDAACAGVLVKLAVYHFGDDVGDDAPHFEALAEAAGVDGFVGGVVGHEPIDAAALFEAFESEFSVDGGHHDVARLGLE
jgi:hypothetical protein